MRTSNLGPLIAVLSLSAFSFTAGQYLPYVITAISGSGVIATASLAIFTVSTIVALVSTAYLIKRAISIAGNEKKIDLSGKEFDQSDQQHTEFPEPTKKSVCENGTDLKNKSSTPTLSQHQLTLGVAISKKPLTGAAPPPPPPPPNSAPPPPPPLPTGGLNSWKPSKDDDTSERSLGGASPKNALPTKLIPPKDNKQVAVDHNAIIQGKAKLKKVDTNAQRKEEQKHDGGIALILARRAGIEYSDSESERSGSSRDSDWSSDEGKDKQKEQKKKVLTKSRKKSTPSNSQSDDEKGTSTSESGYRSNDVGQQYPKIAALPSHQPNTEKPPIPPKPANLQTGPQAPPATTVTEVNSEVKDPSTLPFKDRKAQFEGK
ncbi:hypothetical protein [Wolbachia endosymbiont (group A) of Clivina fossor]|uniref:hypothetical protein n=1 Tax=Wolbachia endosymbiont (group A) of Clivina fossor TaxID=3066133 RepID=UPI003132B1E8